MTAAATQPTAAATDLTGVRKAFYAFYRVLAALFVADIVVQFFLAGAGAFGSLHEKTDDAFELHAANGHILTVASLVMLVVVAVARPGRHLVRNTAWLFVAMIVQNVLAGAGDDNRWVGALHPVNGLIITALAAWIALVCYRRIRPRSSATAAVPEQPNAGDAQAGSAILHR